MTPNAVDPKQCSIEGCERPRYAKGLCQPCYMATSERREQDRVYRAKPEYREKRHAYRVAYREENHISAGSTWAKVRPQDKRAADHRRRARKAGNGGNVTAVELTTLPDFCVFCFSADSLSVEHLVPLDRGGWHVIENLTTACRSCNSSKHVRTPDEWLAIRA